MGDKYATGDKVQLKSGGPIMTVDALMTSTFQTGKYRCQWFSGASLKEGYFPYDSLRPVKDIVDIDV
jgi:uncharacterized protein YodC (DUF2158 family)